MKSNRFCRDIGVARGVLDSMAAKKSSSSSSSETERVTEAERPRTTLDLTARRSNGRIHALGHKPSRTRTRTRKDSGLHARGRHLRWPRRGATSPKAAKECAKIFAQELRFFCGREMAAARHFRPMLHVIPTLDPDPRRERQFFGKMGDSSRRMDEFPFSELQRRFPAREIQTERRVNRLRHPVERYIR